jgi:SSS family solute:Na+ symporter
VITGSIYFTGAFIVMVGGLYWRRASRLGAIAALMAGASAVFGLEPIRIAWISTGSSIFGLDGEYWTAEITSSVVGLCSLGLTAILFVGVSLMTPDETTELQESQTNA